MTTEQAQELVNSTDWYHGWEIVPGVHTPGRCRVSPKEALDIFGVPEDLTGLRALDIGAWDGAYSFELERRGAEVVSIDIQDPDKTGYNTAKKILGSKCEYRVIDICNASPLDYCAGRPTQQLGCFDLILYLGVFYHLKAPMLAWERIRGLMKPDAALYFEGLVFDYAWRPETRLQYKRKEIEALRDLPIAYFAVDEYGYDPENGYVPTIMCLYAWLVAAGFEVKSMGAVENMSRAHGRAKVRVHG